MAGDHVTAWNSGPAGRRLNRHESPAGGSHARSADSRPAPRRPRPVARPRLHRDHPGHAGAVPGRQRRHLRRGPGGDPPAAAVPRARAAGEGLQLVPRRRRAPRPTAACPTTTTAGARPRRSRRSRSTAPPARRSAARAGPSPSASPACRPRRRSSGSCARSRCAAGCSPTPTGKSASTRRCCSATGCGSGCSPARTRRSARPLRINGVVFTVVGVMPADFRFVSNEVQLWTPAAFSPPTAPTTGATATAGRCWPGSSPASG